MQEETKAYLFDGKNFPNWSFRMKTLLEMLIDCIRWDVDEIPEFQEDETAQKKAQKETELTERKLLKARCKSLLVEKIMRAYSQRN